MRSLDLVAILFSTRVYGRTNVINLLQAYLKAENLDVPVEVETETLEQVQEVLDLQSQGKAGHVTRIMLDNMAKKDASQPGKISKPIVSLCSLHFSWNTRIVFVFANILGFENWLQTLNELYTSQVQAMNRVILKNLDEVLSKMSAIHIPCRALDKTCLCIVDM